jgi:cytochrome c
MLSKYFATAILSLELCSCSTVAKQSAAERTGGDPDRGALSVAGYGCGSCHAIPGIPGAHGLVGPSLAGIGSRLYIAGSQPNDPGTLMRWVQDPHSIKEKTAMPNVGVSPHDATDIAAYLYSLE